MGKKRFIYSECPNCGDKLIKPDGNNICFVNYGFKPAEYYYCLKCKSCYDYFGENVMIDPPYTEHVFTGPLKFDGISGYLETNFKPE
jgi:hypothetical protein